MPLFRLLRFAEFLGLFIVLPTILAMTTIGRRIIPIALSAALICTTLLLFDKAFDRRWLWRGDAQNRTTRPHLVRIIVLFTFAAIGMGIATAWLLPDLLFAFPRQNPRMWLLVMCFYPLLSVYPQEIVYRAFIFHRYTRVFPHAWFAPMLSVLAFGYAHVLFKNPVAVLLSLVGGVFFAWTYHRTHSILLVWIEHALYGCFIFTIGLGYYFYSDNIAPIP